MPEAVSGPIRRPFRPTPDLAAYYPAVAHEEARSELMQAWQNGEGIALLDGATGLGKTLVALKFLDDLAPTARRILLPSARFNTPAELFHTILFDLGLSITDTTEANVRLAVTESLWNALAIGVKTVLVLDEAQHLSPILLEEIRLLDNLESRTGKAVFTVLVGLPELRETLTGSLAQRIAARPHLTTFSTEESLGYLEKNLRQLGNWDSEGAEIVANASHGVPRVLNQLASTAIALSDGAFDAEAALAALERFGLVAPLDEPEQPTHPLKSKGANPVYPGTRGEPEAPRQTKQKKRRSA